MIDEILMQNSVPDNITNLLNKSFGDYQVVAFAGKDRHKLKLWICRCKYCCKESIKYESVLKTSKNICYLCNLTRLAPEIVKLYDILTINEICKLYHRDPIIISTLLKTNNCRVKKSIYNIDENYFDQIDTQEKSYFLGFLYADGTSDGKYVVRLCLKNNDIDILNKFNFYLQHDKPLRFNKHGMVELEIANRHIVSQLLKYGVIPRKTFKLEYPDWMPDDMKWHFIRGYFDGDGCLTINKKRKSGQIIIVSTENFCKKLSHIIYNDLGINPGINTRFPERNNNTRQLRFGGNIQVGKFLQQIYNNATVYLDRKYQKYILFYQNYDIN